jgi:hypothetical protein
MSRRPNMTPERTAGKSRRNFGAKLDGACRSAVMVPVWSRRWFGCGL